MKIFTDANTHSMSGLKEDDPQKINQTFFVDQMDINNRPNTKKLKLDIPKNKDTKTIRKSYNSKIQDSINTTNANKEDLKLPKINVILDRYSVLNDEISKSNINEETITR